MLKTVFLAFIFFHNFLAAVNFNWAVISGVVNNEITVLDLDSNTTLSPNIPLPTNPSPATFPLGVAGTPDGKRVYIADHGTNNISVFDMTATPPLAVKNIPVPLGAAGPRWIQVTPNGQFAYVLTDSPTNVTVIDLATETFLPTIIPPNPMATQMNFFAIDPTGNFAYFTDNSANNVSVLDLTTNTFLPAVISLPGAMNTLGITISPNGLFAYTANGTSNNVSVIDLTMNTFVMNIPLPGAQQPIASAITANGTFLYVINSINNTVSVVDTTMNAQIQLITLAGVFASVADIGISPNGDYAYIPISSGAAIKRIQLSNNMEILPEIATPMGTANLTFMGIGRAPAVPPTPPGTNLVQATAKTNSYFWETDVYNLISWSAPSGFTPDTYSIYQDGVLIGQVPATIFTFESHNLNSKTIYTYNVVATNASGSTLDLGSVAVQTKKG
ncbi:MAG: beta-propeller fold lactonase family protein [Parachlamydiales bacterium]|nr:beta-propeller fold lactonase family protein [Parachlamydiales bacterium]